MEKLTILWTTDNKDTLFNMLSMYAVNSVKNHWWDNVNVIIWGASAKLAGNDTQVQTEVMQMIANGVTVEACKACSDNLGVSEKLAQLGVKVRYMGEPLTDYLKSGDKILTI
ncbi:MAG: DsrE family protein [Bacteroidota bacterium]|nr:DsrE family protein [Bacteroidota bacterium]